MDNPAPLDVYDGSNKINPNEIGVSLVDIQDAAGANAYHIPQGILLNYEPNKKLSHPIENDWEEVSVLDYAPSLLKQFGVAKKSYMIGDDRLF